MTSRERVLKAIRHEEPDRVPLNVWLYRSDYAEIVSKKYGSIDGFFDEFGIDIYTVFVAPPWSTIENRPMTLDEALAAKLPDPCDDSLYDGVRAAVKIYGKAKNMCVFCQTGGIFESANGFLGIENNLANMACEPHKTKDFFKKLSEWFAAQSEMIIKCGVDVLHLSDDWGENNRMMFSPKMWREMIFPYEKTIVDVGKKAEVPVSLHSCGYIMDVLEDCVDMGLDVLNPIQTSAGMDAYEVKRRVGDKLCLYGTLDTREVLPRWAPEQIDAEVKQLMDRLKPNGGYIFCSAHTINPDVPLENLEAAYRAALKYGKYEK
ncbi:MAG: uroporphyrinogen decarboxylase family protein [Armatimonadota bacterium]